MKPYVLAKKYCCNHQEDGTCTGISFKPNGDQFRFLPEGTKCLVACGQRCKHLDWAVLPMRFWDWKNPSEGADFRDAADRYRRKHSGIENLAPKQRKCPDCETPIGPRRRYCVNCAEDHRNETYKQSKQKSRAKGI